MDSEAILQLPSGVLLFLTQRQRGHAGRDSVLDKNLSRAQCALEAGVRQLIVLAQINRLCASKFRKNPLPISILDLNRHRRYDREFVLHERDAICDPFRDDKPVRRHREDVLVVQYVVPDASRDVRVFFTVPNGELLVLRGLPIDLRCPGSLTANHENHVAAAPVREDESPIEEWADAAPGRPERGRS